MPDRVSTTWQRAFRYARLQEPIAGAAVGWFPAGAVSASPPASLAELHRANRRSRPVAGLSNPFQGEVHKQTFPLRLLPCRNLPASPIPAGLETLANAQ
jgi:hypothetical protein